MFRAIRGGYRQAPSTCLTSVIIFALVLVIASSVIAQTSKRLVVEALGEVEGQADGKGERWALIVGINRYEDSEINSLRYAVNDAKGLYEVIIDPNIGRFSPDRVKLLTTDAADKRLLPTKSNILYYLRVWLAQNVKPADTVLVFFSGHGYVDGDHKYLLPVDTDTFYVPAYAIDNQEFIEGIDQLKSEKVITLLDSCHSGGVSRSGKGVGDVLPDDFYEQFEAATGRVTLASCSGSEQSFEWPEKKHGVFTYYLLEAMRGAANTQRDQAVTFEEVAEYVGRNVSKWAKEYKNGKQNPRVNIENQSAFGKLALTYDLATGFEIVSEQMKEKLYGYIGTGDNSLGVAEIGDVEKLFEKIGLQLKEHKNPPQSHEDALAVVSDLISGDMSVAQYKRYGGKLVKDALQDNSSGDDSIGAGPVQYGDVKIIAKPWADIYLDDRLVGQTPKILKEVRSGVHTLTLKNPGYKDLTREIRVAPNDTIMIRETLVK